MILPLLALALAPPVYERRAVHDPDGIGVFYLGREIAQVMGHQASDWLDRPEREAEEGVSRLVGLLDLKGGETVVDLGAGSGTITVPLARRVGPRGRVLATDIQPEMLEKLVARTRSLGLKNVEPVLGATDDPKLPEGRADLILLVDVYHEFDRPYEMTRGMIRGLKKGGRLALVEYRANDPRVPIKPLHTMSEAQVRKEMAVFPELEWAGADQRLPRQGVYFFRRR